MSTQTSGVKVEVKNGNLVIELPMNQTPETSKSGKTLVVATTHGNITTPALVNGKPITLGVNAYIRR